MVEGLEQKQESGRDEIARRLVRAVETAGQRIFHEAKLSDRTRAAAWERRSRQQRSSTITFFFAQVGDSRGYILRGDVLTQITRDQSLVNQLIEAGQLTEEEAETFEHNNIILQALGTSETVQVDLTFAELRRGDMLLLCSDGLSGMVRFEEIREIMRSSHEPVDICKSLTERANQAGGHDNITVIIVQFDGEGLTPLESDGEPLKYRKYTLPEEPPENTEPDRRLSPSLPGLSGGADVRLASRFDEHPEGPLRCDAIGGPTAAGPHRPVFSSGGRLEQNRRGRSVVLLVHHRRSQCAFPARLVPAWIVVAELSPRIRRSPRVDRVFPIALNGSRARRASAYAASGSGPAACSASRAAATASSARPAPKRATAIQAHAVPWRFGSPAKMSGGASRASASREGAPAQELTRDEDE